MERYLINPDVEIYIINVFVEYSDHSNIPDSTVYTNAKFSERNS